MEAWRNAQIAEQVLEKPCIRQRDALEVRIKPSGAHESRIGIEQMRLSQLTRLTPLQRTQIRNTRNERKCWLGSCRAVRGRAELSNAAFVEFEFVVLTTISL